MSNIDNMFKYQGKTTRVIGTARTKTYKELYEHISSLQGNKLSYDGNYLANNELADITIFAYEDTPAAHPILARQQTLSHLLAWQRVGKVSMDSDLWRLAGGG